MNETYQNWSEIKYLRDIVTNPLISVGRKSYYSGYYDGHPFENGCVRYLWGDHSTKDLFDPREQFGWKLDRLIIGDFVCIASGVRILLGGNHNHRSDWITVYPFESGIKESFKNTGDTVIKSDAWIGMDALIMPGVTIGEGAIVASGSVVSKEVAPYTIVAGNPAKEVKKRFSPEEISLLLKIRWFDWPDEWIEQHESVLLSGDLNALKNVFESMTAD